MENYILNIDKKANNFIKNNIYFYYNNDINECKLIKFINQYCNSINNIDYIFLDELSNTDVLIKSNEINNIYSEINIEQTNDIIYNQYVNYKVIILKKQSNNILNKLNDFNNIITSENFINNFKDLYKDLDSSTKDILNNIFNIKN